MISVDVLYRTKIRRFPKTFSREVFKLGSLHHVVCISAVIG